MASITREPNGRRTIQFVGADKKRRSLRLGKVSQRTASAVKVRVEHLVVAAITGDAVDDETARWLTGLDDVLRDKLSAVGLVAKRDSATVAGFVDRYVSARTDVKPGTRIMYRQTRRNLVDHFGQSTLLRDVTPGDADEWRLTLIRQGLAPATVRRRCGIAKQFFRAAVRRRLIPANPFDDLAVAVQANPAREYFVTRDEANSILEACPDAQWRLLFALSRYGGLRCPSEHLRLLWEDVDWATSRITIHSPKTEHHAGGEGRTIPLFPELVHPLYEVFEQAEPGTEYVITRYRNTNANLRTQLNRIIKRAGLRPWPKLFQNLRSTRETELAEQWPIHVVCAWLGNSQAVAAKHYLQVTDEHFERAAVANPVQNPVQNPAATSRTASQGSNETHAKPYDCNTLRDNATVCTCTEVPGMGPRGFEPRTSSLSATRSAN